MTCPLEGAAWLASDVLLLVALSRAGEYEAVVAGAANEEVDVVTQVVNLSPNGDDSDQRMLLINRFASPPEAPANGLSMTFSSRAGEFSIDSEELANALTDPLACLRGELLGLEPDQ